MNVQVKNQSGTLGYHAFLEVVFMKDSVWSFLDQALVDQWKLISSSCDITCSSGKMFCLAKRSKCHVKIFCVYIEKECTLVYVHGEYIPFCTLCLFSYKPWQHPYMTSGSWKPKDDISQKLMILTGAQLCCLLPGKSSTAGKKSTIEQQV